MAASTKKLSSGYDCPLLGFGTYMCSDPTELKLALKTAIKHGYRHIDTAQYYQNEGVIGETLQELYNEGVVKRQDIFLTTKLWLTHYRSDLVIPQIQRQTELLKSGYIDLYLLHFPIPMKNDGDKLVPMLNGKMALETDFTFEETWAKLEESVRLGLVRSIGISNFNCNQIERLMRTATIKPAMNQCEMHPFFQQQKLIEYCHRNRIDFTSYATFSNPADKSPFRRHVDVLNDPTLTAIGEKYSKIPAQIILRFIVQRGIFAIPKSVTPSRIVANFQIWDFELTEDDMLNIESMDQDLRCVWWDWNDLELLTQLKSHPDYPFVQAGSC